MTDTDTVFENWQRLRSQIKNESTRGALTAIGVKVQEYSAMRVPVDTGNLANSQYLEIRNLPNGFQAGIGYTANYAGFVHEAAGTLRGQEVPRTGKGSTGNYWDGYGGDQGEPKFLDKAVDEMARDDLQDILDEYYL